MSPDRSTGVERFRRIAPGPGGVASTLMRIETCSTVDADLVAAMARLIPQLSRSAPPPDSAALAAIVGSDACHLLVARDDDGSILGSMTLVVFPIPTGIRAWIEDVVVDDAARGRGVLGNGRVLFRAPAAAGLSETRQLETAS